MLGVALDFENYPSTQTPINGTNLNSMQQLLVNLIYPIGTYYETSNVDFDPNTAWGGTWVLETDGTTLVSKSNATGSKFNADIGAIVGSETHTLTVDELATHNHNPGYGTKFLVNTYPVQSQVAYSENTSATKYFDYDNCNTTSSVGGSQPHNNVQPSKITNRWHRTA